MSQSPVNLSIVSPLSNSLVNNLLEKYLFDKLIISRQNISTFQQQKQQKQELEQKQEKIIGINSNTQYLRLNFSTNLSQSLSGINSNRSIGYLSGYLPSRLKNGIKKENNSIYFKLLLYISQQIINQRLYEVVREKYHLAYDPSIYYDLSSKGIYFISIPSSNNQVEKALQVTKDALISLTENGISQIELLSSIEYIKQKILQDSERHEYWLNILHENKVIFHNFAYNYNCLIDFITLFL